MVGALTLQPTVGGCTAASAVVAIGMRALFTTLLSSWLRIGSVAHRRRQELRTLRRRG